jgi:hypothetical protein
MHVLVSLESYRCHNWSSRVLKGCTSSALTENGVQECFSMISACFWNFGKCTGATMCRVQFWRLHEFSFGTKLSTRVFLHVFCQFWVLCEFTGATMGWVQMWRLHEFNFDSKWITSVLLHVLSKYLVMCGNIQVPQWIDYSCQYWTRLVLTPSRVQECFLMLSAIFWFFVEIQVPQVDEYSCEGCTSSDFTATWVHDCFSSCFLQDLLSLWNTGVSTKTREQLWRF